MNSIFLLNRLWFDFTLGIIFALFISIISYRLRFLTFSGSIATLILAVIIFGFGTWKWTIPIVTFFLLSSLLSRYRIRKTESVEKFSEKPGARDHLQVLANGGLGSVLVILYFLFNYEIIYIIFVSVIASMCADTWATEIGMLNKTKTVDIISFREVEQGFSGGISIAGSLSSIAGAFVIAATSIPWLESNHLINVMIIVVSGFAGSVADSILGSRVQVQYKCNICGRITERKVHCGNSTVLIRGKSWMNNDAVNFGAGLSGGIFSLILFDIVKT